MSVRWPLWVAITAMVALVARLAHAEPTATEAATTLGAEARAAQAAGDLEGAIVRWKQAYARDPAPAYLCNLGLALIDADALDRAHRYLTLCLARGDLAAGPAADIAADRLRIEAVLRARGQVPVSIAVTPVGADITVPGWPADEVAAAPTIVWLPPGPTTLTARAPGHRPGTIALVVAPPGPMRAELALVAVIAAVEPVVRSRPNTCCLSRPTETRCWSA